MLLMPNDYNFDVVDYYQPTESDGLLKTFLNSVGQGFTETREPVLVAESPLPELRPYDSFITPQNEIPQPYSIPLTDKTSTIYGDVPKVSSKSSGVTLPYYKEEYTKPYREMENTVFTNPATLALEQVQLTPNQLEQNYAGTTTSISGHESVLAPFLQNRLAETQPDTSERLSVSTTKDECWIPGATSGCWIRKDVRNETIAFIVGAILLTVGIIALTR